MRRNVVYLFIGLLIAAALHFPVAYMPLGLLGLDLWLSVLTPAAWITHTTLQLEGSYPLPLAATVLSIALYTPVLWATIWCVHLIRTRRQSSRLL